MSDTSDQAVIEELHARRGVLSIQQLTMIVGLLESSSRQNHNAICNHAREVRELEKEGRETRDKTRTLAGQWNHVWDNVRIAFSLTSTQLRRELRKRREVSHIHAEVITHCLSAIVNFDERLEALEAAAGIKPTGPNKEERAAS